MNSQIAKFINHMITFLCWGTTFYLLKVEASLWNFILLGVLTGISQRVLERLFLKENGR